MKYVWLLSIVNPLRLQAAQGSPLTSASSTTSNPLSAVTGASTISAAPPGDWTACVLANSAPQNLNSIIGFRKATTVKGPVTTLKKIEPIPQPVPSDPSVEVSGLVATAENQVRDVPLSVMNAQQAKLPTISPPAEPESSFEQRHSPSLQATISQPIDQSGKTPMLPPIIVGGITYVLVHAYHTHSNTILWQQNSRSSQTESEGVAWYEYYVKHDSEPDGLDHETLKSGQTQIGLPPVVVGGLTYKPVGKGFKPGWQTTAPVDISGSAKETAKPAANPSVGEGMLTANSQYSASPGVLSTLSIQSQSALPPASSNLGLGSQTMTALPGRSGLMLGSSTLLPGSPTITVTSESPFGSLTVADKTFIPLGNTAISIDGTTLSISGPAMTENGTVLSLASGGLVVGSSTFALPTPAPYAVATTTSWAFTPTPAFAVSGQSVVPASPTTFVIEGQTFTAYPSGLAIDGTEVFQGSTAITLSGTAISLGSSEIVIGASTIPFASVTGLGAALSSGLPTVGSTSSVGFGPTLTGTASTKGSHQSAAGQLRIPGKMVMVWLAMIALTIAVG